MSRNQPLTPSRLPQRQMAPVSLLDPKVAILEDAVALKASLALSALWNTPTTSATSSYVCTSYCSGLPGAVASTALLTVAVRTSATGDPRAETLVAVLRV